MVPSEANASRRGRAPSGNGYSRMVMDCGSMLASSVRAKFAEERNSILRHDNSVGHSMLRGRRLHFDITRARIQPADHARFLEREPQDSLLIENGCTRIFRVWIRHAVFGNLTGFRIELTDVALKDGREPDISLFVTDQ